MEGWKTAIVALVTALTGIVTLMQSDPWIASHPQASGVLLTILGALNFVIRFFTTKPIFNMTPPVPDVPVLKSTFKD